MNWDIARAFRKLASAIDRDVTEPMKAPVIVTLHIPQKAYLRLRQELDAGFNGQIKDGEFCSISHGFTTFRIRPKDK